MTSDKNSSRSHAKKAEVANEVLRTHADSGELDATVVPVGTFAAGQSADGRHVTASTAPEGSFAAGQEEEAAPEK
jgi:hypothetical protein